MPFYAAMTKDESMSDEAKAQVMAGRRYPMVIRESNSPSFMPSLRIPDGFVIACSLASLLTTPRPR